LYILMALPLLVLAGVLVFIYKLGRNKTSPRAAALAEKLGVRQADEMERLIQYKAATLAYAVVVWMLVLYSFYVVLIRKESMPLTNLAVLAGLLTQCIATLVLRHRSTAGDEEYHPYPMWKTLLLVVAISAVIAAIGAGITIVVLAW
ncbi:MAG: hypothetical protein Q3Y08_07905, partial [Butyricicoccus sp.]|nr:hypothetical protein [Butyricicoccus sp.]